MLGPVPKPFMMQSIGLKAGYRTPFVKMGGPFHALNAVDLSRILIDETLAKINFSDDYIQHVIWGMVVPDPDIYSIAREVVLASRLKKTVEAYSVNRACATSLQAATNAAFYYQAFPQEKSVSLVGGVESFSSVRPVLTKEAARYVKNLARKGNFIERITRALQIPVAQLFPVAPSAKEYSTGLTMGEHCELMVAEFKIGRNRQDEFALRSHQNASRARSYLASQIIQVGDVDRDLMIRDSTSMEQLSQLSPAFDRLKGTITAGNASPFTDGTAGLFVISPGLEHEIKPDARLIDFEYVGIVIEDGLLMGPAKAMLRVMKRQNLKWADLDYIEFHEAFAGQVLCNVDAINDPKYRLEKYGIDYDAGILDEKVINPWGSSVAYGHPFGATGARMLSQAMAFLKHHNKRFALVSACTAGGLAGACLISR